MRYRITFEDEKEYKKVKSVVMYATYPNHLLEQIKLLLQWLSIPHLISVEEIEWEHSEI
jgi:hypothetical protein